MNRAMSLVVVAVASVSLVACGDDSTQKDPVSTEVMTDGTEVMTDGTEVMTDGSGG